MTLEFIILKFIVNPISLFNREMLPSLALLANMSYQAKAVEIMTAHALDVSDSSCYYDNF